MNYMAITPILIRQSQLGRTSLLETPQPPARPAPLGQNMAVKYVVHTHAIEDGVHLGDTAIGILRGCANLFCTFP